MSTWNYRVLERADKKTGEKTYAIHEVYYNDEDQPDNCTENAVAPMGESLEELKGDIEYYLRALKIPVLVYDSLEEAEVQWEK